MKKSIILSLLLTLFLVLPGTTAFADSTVYGDWSYGATITNPTITNPTVSGGTVSGSDITVGAGKTLDVSAGTLTLADDQITTAKIHAGALPSDVTVNNDNWSGADLSVANGGTGASTLADGGLLVGAGTGAVEVVTPGATTEILVGGGAGTNPVWTTATGSGAPVRATSPTLVTPALGTPASGTLTNCTGYPSASTTVTGISELATTDETITGTDTARTTTPAGVAGAMAVQTNSLAKSQGVRNLGNSPIQVADNDNLDNPINNFSIVWTGSLDDWIYASSYDSFMFRKYASNYGVDFLSAYTGRLRLGLYRNDAGTLFLSTSINTFIDGTEHQLIVVVTRETASTPGSVVFYVDGHQFGDSVEITTAETITIANSASANLMWPVGGTAYKPQNNKELILYNRALTAAEVLDLYRNGIAFADKWGSQTEQTSGTLTVGKRYRINNWITDDDFTNVGGTNEDGNEFVATGTTPTKWTNSSTVVPAGVTLALEPEGIQPAPGQWLDSSTNKLHAMQPASGSSLLRKKDTFEVRWTNTWAGTHEAQYIGGFNQAVLPANCYIESIIGVVSGATIEDIIIGDGSDTDRWVTITTGLSAGTTSFTLANRISDGTNYKLVVDPDANFTGSIAWTIKGIILQ